MIMDIECVPCYLRQAIRASSMVTRDRRVQEKAVREIMKYLLSIEWNIPPMLLAPRLYGIIRKVTGSNDPYQEVKKLSNKIALSLYEELKSRIMESTDPLLSAIKIAIAGNIVDFGALSYSVNIESIRKVVEETLNKPFAINDYIKFKGKLKKARTLLYFFDNAGEIVFDKLLIETIMKVTELEKLTFVVKGGPLINDATVDDLRDVGLDRIKNSEIKTISNGDPGTGYPMDSPEILEWIKNNDVVIAKGQGNYELLSKVRNVFFMLMVKCHAIARNLNVNVGDIILKYNL